jgi:hypothetical protein
MANCYFASTWHETLLHPIPYVIDFKRALNFGEAQPQHDRLIDSKVENRNFRAKPKKTDAPHNTDEKVAVSGFGYRVAWQTGPCTNSYQPKARQCARPLSVRGI